MLTGVQKQILLGARRKAILDQARLRPRLLLVMAQKAAETLLRVQLVAGVVWLCGGVSVEEISGPRHVLSGYTNQTSHTDVGDAR